MTEQPIPLNVQRLMDVIKTSIKESLGDFKPLSEDQQKKLKDDMRNYIEQLPASPSFTSVACCVSTKHVVTGRHHDLHVLYIYNDGTQEQVHEGGFSSNRRARLYYKAKCKSNPRTMRVRFVPIEPIKYIDATYLVTERDD